MGLPFAFVLVLVMLGVWKALRVEGLRAESGVHHLPVMIGARHEDKETWRVRLARATNFVDRDMARDYLDRVVEPSLREVAEELSAQGVPATLLTHETAGERSDPGLPPDPELAVTEYVELRTEAQEHPFVYRVEVTESPVPTYGGRMIGGRDKYARLEVHLGEGGQNYDVMGYSKGQLIHDCLDQYERHLEFLRLS
jgi:choline/glycine/proline betaine transport protein